MADDVPSPPTVPILTAPLPAAALLMLPIKDKLPKPSTPNVSPPRVAFADQSPTPPVTYAYKTRNLGKQRRE
eukprot:scaffold155660_cov58-Attheya_sp.AAC.3